MAVDAVLIAIGDAATRARAALDRAESGSSIDEFDALVGR
jgi:hypothetical protein